jgi:hypothetical protein
MKSNQKKGEKIMKKILSVLCAAAAAVAMSSAAFAAPGAGDNSPGSGIYRSVHDLTNGPNGTGAPLSVPGFVTDSQQRLCAYCHTPHHAIKVGDAAAGTADYLPLWSHAVSTVTYTPYASASFTPLGGTSMASDPLTGPSRLCMSCHDGLTAVDNYYGLTGGHVMQPQLGSFSGNPVINGDGNTNHPLGFAMIDVIPGYAGATHADTANILSLNATSKFKTGLTDNVNIVDRLYQGAIMTCSSCHDVHNTLNKVSTQAGAGNFLLLGSQKNSGICLSCHTQGGGDSGAATTSVPSAAFTY